jgi:hypothetical protein
MNERAVRRLLAATPVDGEAEERTWAVVRAAFEEREPVRAGPRRSVRLALALAAVAVGVGAAALSPPGRAVVNAVRRSIGIEHAAPALFRLPAAGRLLVAGEGGAWVIAADGSTRRLGSYSQASWSPHARYVVAATQNELFALEPNGRVHWQLARPAIRFPRWGGTHTDTRIAYLTTSRLHVVAGDGTGDVDAEGLPAAAPVAPAWQPTTVDRHVLAYVTTRGRVTVFDPARGSVSWISPRYADPRVLAWTPDGRTLALATRTDVVLFAAATGDARVVPVADVRALAFAPSGRLAVLRGHSVLLLEGETARALFVAPARLAGLAWSPDGRWLLTSLPGADQWIFVQARGGHRVLAVSHIAAQFGSAFPTLSGWAP